MNLDLVQIEYTPNAHDLENCVEGDCEWKKYGKNICIKKQHCGIRQHSIAPVFEDSFGPP